MRAALGAMLHKHRELVNLPEEYENCQFSLLSLPTELLPRLILPGAQVSHRLGVDVGHMAWFWNIMQLTPRAIREMRPAAP